MKYNVFIATSLEGFIATESGGIEWLETLPTIENEDYGYQKFVTRQDAILMGRHTFEKVLSFGFWPYELPVFVLSHKENLIPTELKGKATQLNKPIIELESLFDDLGFENIYIDGGKLISGFLDLNLVDDLIITHMPISLGTGIRLFETEKENIQRWNLVDIKSFSNGILQTHYTRG